VYCFVRRDLPIPQIAVQACHALIEARHFLEPDQVHPHLVLCGLKKEQDLNKVALHLSSSGIRYRAYAEDDMADQLTAIATEPIVGERRLALKKYQLLRG
jgi:hypothetical protein